MREALLASFFGNSITAQELASDLNGKRQEALVNRVKRKHRRNDAGICSDS